MEIFGRYNMIHKMTVTLGYRLVIQYTLFSSVAYSVQICSTVCHGFSLFHENLKIHYNEFSTVVDQQYK